MTLAETNGEAAIDVYNLIHQAHKVTCRFSSPLALLLCAETTLNMMFNSASDLIVVVCRLITANKRIYFYLISAYYQICLAFISGLSQHKHRKMSRKHKCRWNPLHESTRLKIVSTKFVNKTSSSSSSCYISRLLLATFTSTANRTTLLNLINIHFLTVI